MTPVYQTRHGPPDGNCFAACVASLLDRRIEEVDVDVASCGNSLRALLTKIEQKANCKIYYATHEAIVDGIFKTSERYCFAEVCTCVFDGNPYGEGSTWHVVVCEIADDAKISLVFNPDKNRPATELASGIPCGWKSVFRKGKARTLNPAHTTPKI